jgi:hypothetical protein
MLRIIHPNQYVKEPTKRCHKPADPAIKEFVQDEAFADGFLHLVLDIYRLFKASGNVFQPIPQVMTATEEANEAEEEDIIQVLSEAIDFAEPFRSDDFYKESDHLLQATEFKRILDNLKKAGKLKGCSYGGIAIKLGNNGYPKKQVRYNGENAKFYLGLLEKKKAETEGEVYED